MKKITLFLTYLVFLSNFVSSAAFAYDKEIIVAYIDKINPPFVIDPKRPNPEYQGITLDILTRLGKKIGAKFVYQNMPWTRCLYSLENNKVDAIFHASFKQKRMENGVYPMKDNKVDPAKRLIEQTYYIYKRKDSLLHWDGEKFTHLNQPIGVITGFSIANDLNKMQIDYEEAPSILSNLSKLKFSRLDAVINYASQTDITLFKHDKEFKSIEKLQLSFMKKEKYLMFSHDFYNNNKDLVETIWDNIKQMRVSGELDQIMKKYWL